MKKPQCNRSRSAADVLNRWLHSHRWPPCGSRCLQALQATPKDPYEPCIKSGRSPPLSPPMAAHHSENGTPRRAAEMWLARSPLRSPTSTRPLPRSSCCTGHLLLPDTPRTFWFRASAPTDSSTQSALLPDVHKLLCTQVPAEMSHPLRGRLSHANPQNGACRSLSVSLPRSSSRPTLH